MDAFRGARKRPTPPRSSDLRVFIVHGHDTVTRDKVDHCLRRVGLQPIILQQQASSSDTLIEKFERYSDVSYAVVLLTPDDEGRRRGSSDQFQERARQNVVFELGYFIAKLGRKRVCALHRGALELPSDFRGIVYVALDGEEPWTNQLAKELLAAGFPVDLEGIL